MNITRKALLIWWSLAPLMLLVFAIGWELDNRTRMMGFGNLIFLLGFAAIWGNILAKLTTAQKNSKNIGAAK